MNRQQKPSEYYPEPVQEYNSYVDYESNNNTNYEYQQPQEGLPQQEYDPPPSQTTEITSALFEFPPDSKLYRCTRTEGDRKQVFYVPVPSHATIADVENLLPPDIRDCPRLEIEAVENHDYKFIPTEFSHQAPPPQGPPGQKVQTVNAKQYKRIEKRREARRRLEEQGRIPLERQKYLYESRHAHAMKRKRMPTGRFDGDATPFEIPQKQPPQQPQATRQYSEYAQIQPAAPWRDYQYFPPATMHYQYN
uniref:Nuclear transcription factor Y subunit n=1 Tax=Caenorhabditis tropicalis TaxID=1561998 RepID=A0A1I7U6V7_9PELO